MSNNEICVLGVDTSLRCSGVGVIKGTRHKSRALTFGIIKNSPKLSHSDCLLEIHRTIRDLIEKYQPDAISIEGIFYSKNPKTAMILGQARGVVLLAAAEAAIPIHEYAPRLVKKSMVGTGSADKSQVAQMVMRILSLSEEPSPDAADALGIALTHLQQMHLPSEIQTKRL